MDKNINEVEKQNSVLQGATASLFALCALIIFRMLVLKQFSFDLLTIAFVGTSVKEYCRYKTDRKKESMFFAIASFLLTICCCVVYIISVLDGTL